MVQSLRGLALIASASLLAASPVLPQAPSSQPLALSPQPLALSPQPSALEVIRTDHGVPHIRAGNLHEMGFGLAWVMLEDHGPRTALNVLRARGALASVFGRDSVESDFVFRPARTRAGEMYHLLDQDTRDVYQGFAAGINRYVARHPAMFPEHMPADFTGPDVAALDVGLASPASARRFLQAIGAAASSREEEAHPDPNDGSNAWALGPGRTASGHAILLRNPHLSWSAGYYEAHVTVPGVIDFYGDFRIGGPFTVIGGFNRDLGWATTNNDSDRDEVYALAADTSGGGTDRYLLDGRSEPLIREEITVLVRRNGAPPPPLVPETREFWRTPLGPVIHRDRATVYVLKTAGEGDWRAGEQFLRMMRARSLEEWRTAMRMRARVSSNFTYADRAGNIQYLWMSALPVLPHPSGGDTLAIPARGLANVWTRYVPFDSLPQLLNPPGGYLHNENDSPHFTNLAGPADTVNAYPNFEPPEFRLRSQLALRLVEGTDRLSLEEVVRRKHDYRMLLAERVRPDLLAALTRAGVTGDEAQAADLIRSWDGTVAPESRGGVLFEAWWRRYAGNRPDSLRFRRVWSAASPIDTPVGLADPDRAVEAFGWAVREIARRHGSWDVAWGEVHRVVRGEVDVPVGGCDGALGCFRVLSFQPAPDGRRVASGGDGWVLAVEFGAVPRAVSVLAYGQSPDSTSPWHADQAAMFARGELKPVAFTSDEVAARAVLRYRPGDGTEP